MSGEHAVTPNVGMYFYMLSFVGGAVLGILAWEHFRQQREAKGRDDG